MKPRNTRKFLPLSVSKDWGLVGKALAVMRA